MARVNEVTHIGFFGVNVGRQPLAGAHVFAPAIEVEIHLRCGGRPIGSVESDNVVVLILSPDASFESSERTLLRSDIENKCSHFTEKFTADIFDAVVFPVEVSVDDQHLRKPSRQILYRIKLSDLAGDAAGDTAALKQRMFFVFGVEIQLSKEVPVADWTEGEFVVLVQTLQVCFDQRMQAPHL